MDSCPKFKFLQILKKQNWPFFHQRIPPFLQIDENSILGEPDNSPVIEPPWIIRSGLPNEGGSEQLLAGKSVSIKNIRDRVQLKQAFFLIKNQYPEAFVVKQQQINYKWHLTLIIQKGFLFGEINVDQVSLNSPNDFKLKPLILTKSFSSVPEEIKNELTELLNYFEKQNLMATGLLEGGWDGEKMWIFQIVPFQNSLFRSFVFQGLWAKILGTYQHAYVVERNKNQLSFWSLLRKEIQALKFRRQFEKGNLSLDDHFLLDHVFKNWEFIFHYFYLFCRQNGLQSNNESLAKFLYKTNEQHGQKDHQIHQIHKNHWPDRAYLHLKIAQHFRQIEGQLQIPHMSVGMTGELNLHRDGLLFMGQGSWQGSLGDVAILREQVTPEEMYLFSRDKVILSNSNSLLNHGVLVALERKIPIVLNVPGYLWHQLSNSDPNRIILHINFEQQRLVIQ